MSFIAINSVATRFTRRLVLLAALLAFVPAQAQSLYTARVELDRSATNPRIEAYESALITVLERVSGAELASDPSRIAEIFPDPAAYVLRFRPGEDDTLWVTFDGDAVERRLRQAGQLVWGGDRPPTLIWLAVDWGDGERELLTAPEETPPVPRPVDDDVDERAVILRERVLAVAERRGLPVLFPLLDAEDLKTASFADVWGGFAEPVLDASSRYDVNSILVGRVRADGAQVNRWTYYLGDEQRNYTGAPEQVLSLVADRLASEYAIGGNEPVREVSLSVSGVATVEAYGELQRLLEDIPLIEALSIVAVDGDRIDYRVAAYGGATRLARALRLDGLIEEERINVDGPAAIGFSERLDFYYDPQ